MTAILRRLKKIMALSESSNPGEAATALRQAERLMAKYEIQAEDIELSSVVELDIDAKGVNLSSMEKRLASVVGAAFGVGLMASSCIPVKGNKRPKGKVVFVGDSRRVVGAKYIFITLRRQLIKGVRETFSEILVSAGLDKKALRLDAKRRDAYCEGWCAAVMKQIEDFVPEVSPHVDTYIQNRTKGAIAKAPVKAKLDAEVDALTVYMTHRGVKDGMEVRLHRGVSNSGSATALPRLE
ncbi:hypothetical protein BLL52_4139 [Rhodoferax antarcticus ANT.BR]|uniref:Uncharacterized protein n=2 Tax=Rhodoferax antarcticus TaxID=81479 RepID=A0A1Q8Y984_9BURK|nr:hypothetical protein BLL52_4139 [Rhodoferax antarcticus ANT.BR]